MSFTTVSIRHDVALKLKSAKAAGESYSDTIERLLENQPARSAGDWLDSLAPLEGRSLFSAGQRTQLRKDQHAPRRSPRGRRAPA